MPMYQSKNRLWMTQVQWWFKIPTQKGKAACLINHMPENLDMVQTYFFYWGLLPQWFLRTWSLSNGTVFNHPIHQNQCHSVVLLKDQLTNHWRVPPVFLGMCLSFTPCKMNMVHLQITRFSEGIHDLNHPPLHDVPCSKPLIFRGVPFPERETNNWNWVTMIQLVSRPTSLGGLKKAPSQNSLPLQ